MDLIETTKYPALYGKLDDVCEVGKSNVPYDKSSGPKTRNKLGYGLIASRDINCGEKFYTILESGYDFNIVPRKKNHFYKAFTFTKSSVMVPVLREEPSIYEPEAKPLLYFIQHHDPGNIEVGNLHLMYIHLTYT